MATQECLGPEGTCHCVASDLLERLGTTYAMDVLCVIGSHDSVRFSTLEEHLPEASTSTLSARLDELGESGLIVREQYEEVPPRVEYRLSEEGRDLAQRLRPLFDWIGDREGGDGDRDEFGSGEADHRGHRS